MLRPKNILKLTLFVLLICLIINSLPLATQAQNCSNTSGGTVVCSLDNPLGSSDLTPTQIYGRLIYAFMGATGALALVMFLIGGFQWMTAAGNAERVKKGRDTLMWAVLGLVVIFSSYAILRAVLETLQFST